MTSPARRAMAASILKGCSCSFTLSPFFFNSRASRSISKMPNRKPCGDCDVLDTSNSTLKRAETALQLRISPRNYLSHEAVEKLSVAEFRRIDVLVARRQYA